MDILQLAKEYKRKTASRYLPVSSEEITTKIIESDEYSVSKKYDGHLFLLYFDGKTSTLYNHGGKKLTDLGLLKEADELLKGKCKEIVFAGELYLHKDGERSRSFDLTAALGDNHKDIQYKVFDILILDGEEKEFNIKELNTKLKELLKTGNSVNEVETSFVESRKEIESLFQDIVVKGNKEGIVVQSDNGPTYKIKPLITLDAVVVGFSEGEGSRENKLKELLLALKVSENEYLTIAKVGNGFTDEQRDSIFKELEKQKVDSDYVEVSSSNIAFTMVKPIRVVEFSCLDVFNENSKGNINKMSLTFEENAYSAEFKKPSVSITAGVFLSFREDKKVNSEDVGISQITKILPLESKDKNVSEIKESKLLHREVYVKESKGIKKVRKFVVWKTNKEESKEFPAFVYHYTDYSPDRKDSLKKEIKVSENQKEIEMVLKTELEDNVKKGWEKIN
jgi:ATP-dependent DNA ligase